MINAEYMGDNMTETQKLPAAYSWSLGLGFVRYNVKPLSIQSAQRTRK